VAVTANDRELLDAIRKLTPLPVPQAIRAALRDYYRSLTHTEWRPGAPASYDAVARERRTRRTLVKEVCELLVEDDVA
jgi:hypothetical protein